jgi:hypothetical protein
MSEVLFKTCVINLVPSSVRSSVENSGAVSCLMVYCRVDEPSVSIKGGKLTDLLSDCQLLKNTSAA